MSEEETTMPEEVEAPAEEVAPVEAAPEPELRKGAKHSAKLKELTASFRSRNGRKTQPKPKQEATPRPAVSKKRSPVNRAEAKRAHARARRESLFRRKVG